MYNIIAFAPIYIVVCCSTIVNDCDTAGLYYTSIKLVAVLLQEDVYILSVCESQLVCIL